MCQPYIESATVLSDNNLLSHFPFNIRDLSLHAGRVISLGVNVQMYMGKKHN